MKESIEYAQILQIPWNQLLDQVLFRIMKKEEVESEEIETTQEATKEAKDAELLKHLNIYILPKILPKPPV